MSKPTPQLSRRTLFASAGTAGALAAAASLVPAARELAPTELAKPEPPARGGGYQLTERVKRYYQTTTL